MMFECIDIIYPSVFIDTVTGSICSFNDEYDGLPLKSCVSQITGYQEGSGIPSPSNVRPLHAFSSGTLNKTGKNLFDNSNTSISGNNMWFYGNSSTYKFWKAGTYMCSAIFGSAGISIFYTLQGASRSTTIMTTATSGLRALSFTLPQDGYYRIFAQKAGGISADDVVNPMIAISDDLTHEPYTGNTYTFIFGQSIYQGSIDWKRGVVVMTWGYIASYNGETLTGEWLCNKALYEVGTTPPTGSQVAYELAEPIEIPLGGINLLTQQGVNNIFADCGDTTVEYIKIV